MLILASLSDRIRRITSSLALPQGRAVIASVRKIETIVGFGAGERRKKCVVCSSVITAAQQRNERAQRSAAPGVPNSLSLGGG